MEDSNTINISLVVSRRMALFLLAAFFVSWRPGFLGSETLTLTTYYPAPYGGYASLLTTGQTLLARDGGNVGIGTAATAPLDRLTVMGNDTAISTIEGPVRNRMFSADDDATVLGGHIGTASAHPLYFRTNDVVRMGIDTGGEVQVAGNLRVAGTIVGMCEVRAYSTAAMMSPCSVGHTIFQTYGTGVPQTYGYFTDALGTPIGRLGFGQDWNGNMLCCRIN